MSSLLFLLDSVAPETEPLSFLSRVLFRYGSCYPRSFSEILFFSKVVVEMRTSVTGAKVLL